MYAWPYTQSKLLFQKGSSKMKFVNDLELGKKIIIDRYPEFNNSNFTADNYGWDNFVIKIDN